jgi:hypothetical protein
VKKRRVKSQRMKHRNKAPKRLKHPTTRQVMAPESPPILIEKKPAKLLQRIADQAMRGPRVDVVIALAMAALAAEQHQSSYNSSLQGLDGLCDFYAGVAGYGPVPPDRTGTRSIWSHPMLIGRRGF